MREEVLITDKNIIVQILRRSMRQKVSKIIPGLLEFLDLYCKIKLGKDFYTLLVETPCTLYKSLSDFYKDERTVNITLKLILKTVITEEKDLDNILNYVKNCKTTELVEILNKVLTLNTSLYQ